MNFRDSFFGTAFSGFIFRERIFGIHFYKRGINFSGFIFREGFSGIHFSGFFEDFSGFFEDFFEVFSIFFCDVILVLFMMRSCRLIKTIILCTDIIPLLAATVLQDCGIPAKKKWFRSIITGMQFLLQRASPALPRSFGCFCFPNYFDNECKILPDFHQVALCCKKSGEIRRTMKN